MLVDIDIYTHLFIVIYTVIFMYTYVLCSKQRNTYTHKQIITKKYKA